MKNTKNITGKGVPFLDLSRAFRPIRQEIERAVSGVLDSSRFILGKNVRSFEKEFAAFCGTKYCAGVANGTEALYLALRSLGIGPGDEVILPPNTAFPTFAAVVQSQATPTFCDIDPENCHFNANKLQEQIGPQTKAIIVVHLYGNPVNIAPILEIANGGGIPLVEDACQAHGATYKGRRVGGIGHIGSFSFYPTKNLGALGDGGCVVTNDKLIYEKIVMLRNYGEKIKNHFEYCGINSRLDEIQAAVLRVKLKQLEGWNVERARIAQYYNKNLKGVKIFPVPEYGCSANHLYVIRTSRREELRSHLTSRSIETQIHYPVPLHLQRAYKKLKYPRVYLPEAESATREILSLPLFPGLSQEEQDQVITAINEF